MRYAVQHVATRGWIAEAPPGAETRWRLTRHPEDAFRFVVRGQAEAVRRDLDTFPPSYEVVGVDPEEWEADRDF